MAEQRFIAALGETGQLGRRCLSTPVLFAPPTRADTLTIALYGATDVWPLTGWAEELKLWRGLLGSGDSATRVVIVRCAGVGKTRLAREAITEASHAGWGMRWWWEPKRASGSRWVHSRSGSVLDGNPLQIVRKVIAAVTSDTQGRHATPERSAS